MKKIVFLCLLSLFLSTARAQDGEDVGWVARFGAAGGFTPTVLFPDLNPVNDLVRNLQINQTFGKGVLALGGGGYAYIMLMDNFRVGGTGISGSLKVTGSAGGFDREVDYNYGLGGLTIEYTLPFINRIAVSVGTIIGAGSSSIQIYKNKNDFNWSNIDQEPVENQNRKYTNSFFTVTPTLNVDIPVNRFIAFRIGGGYVIPFNNEWKADNDRSIGGVPSNLTSNSFFIQTGIYFGLFAF
jgi:hypothetical protein